MLCDIAVVTIAVRAPGATRRCGLPATAEHRADDDLIGALAERHADVIGSECFKGAVINVAPIRPGVSFAAPPHSKACKPSMHSSTIFSCGTSRDQIVRSAC